MTRTNAKEYLMLRAAGPQAIQLLVHSAFGGRDAEGRPMDRASAHYPVIGRPAGRGFLARLGGGLKRIGRSLAEIRTRHRAITELSRLDDRLLRDIGLERGTIAEAVDAAMEERAPSWALDNLTNFGRRVVQPLVRPILRWRRDAVTLGMLGELDDHLLADIGVTRGDLRYQPETVLRRARTANANREPRRAA